MQPKTKKQPLTVRKLTTNQHNQKLRVFMTLFMSFPAKLNSKIGFWEVI